MEISSTVTPTQWGAVMKFSLGHRNLYLVVVLMIGAGTSGCRPEPKNKARYERVKLEAAAGVSTVTLADPGAVVGGGQLLTLTFTAAGTTLSALRLQFAADGANYIDVVELPVTATSYDWTVPVLDVPGARLRISSVDAAGKTISATTAAFAIDSTGPAAPSATLASASPTTNPTVAVTVADCTDRAMIQVMESATAPARSAAGWAACATAAGTHSLVLTSDATRAISVWAKDAVGNVSKSAGSVAVGYDITGPTTSLRIKGGAALASGYHPPIMLMPTDMLSGVASYRVSLDSKFENVQWSATASAQLPFGLKRHLRFMRRRGTRWATSEPRPLRQ